MQKVISSQINLLQPCYAQTVRSQRVTPADTAFYFCSSVSVGSAVDDLYT